MTFDERRTRRQVVKAASAPVLRSISEIAYKKRSWPCIGTASPIYGRKAVKYVRKIFDTDISAKDREVLANYLAHALIGHLFDGWRYLSHSLLALISGARAKSIHLAYYAELRAALSILATGGICILDNTNFSLDENGDVHWFGGRTHTAVWTALQAWADRDDIAAQIFSSFICADLSGVDWARACDPSGTGGDIPKAWVEEWAVDLSAIHEDQNARNLASYNPDLSKNIFSPVNKKELYLLTDINRATIAVANGIVRDLDKAIIRQLCEIYFKRQAHNRNRFWSAIGNNLQTVLGYTKMDARQKINALRSPVARAAQKVMACSNGPTGIEAEPQHLICRALMLLRLGSSLVRQRCAEAATLSSGMPLRWRDALLTDFAVASQAVDEGAALADALAVDIAELQALSEVESYLAAEPDLASGNSLWKMLSLHLVNLARVERLGVRAIA